ncbi:MAG: hypothetical protein EB168_10545 [Euryarchaeota archaeon]|nr:hypothetical protein [Euryarchaeota archaeon]
MHTDDSSITGVDFKGAYAGSDWPTLDAGTQDGMMWSVTITTNPGTYEWGAQDQSGNWLGTNCEDVDGTVSDDTTNCEFTVAADGTVTGQNKLHVMVAA